MLEDGKGIKDTYMNNVIEDSSELYKIQSMKKLRDHVYRLRQERKLRPETVPINALADEELRLMARFRSETNPETAFIQSVSFPDRTQPPAVICYHKQNMKRLAVYIKRRNNVVLGIDRTFSLSTHFVTTLTMSIDNFKRPNSSHNPTFAMAYLLHTKCSQEYYSSFLCKIKDALRKESLDLDQNNISIETTGPEEELYSATDEINLNKFMIGSDQELAITGAIQEVFPNQPYLLCLLHLKKNCLSNLTQKCKTTPFERRSIMRSIYHHSEGLMGSQDASSFDLQLGDILEEYSSRDDVRRYITMAASKIREHSVLPFLQLNRVVGWCNNGNESINASLKRAVEWRQVPVVGLVEKLEELSNYEHKEIQRMLCGRGEFHLSKICRNLRFQSVQDYHACRNKEKEILKLFDRVPDVQRYVMEENTGVALSKAKIAKKPGTTTAKGKKTRSLKKFGRKRKFRHEDSNTDQDEDDVLSDEESVVQKIPKQLSKAKQSLKTVFRKLVRGTKRGNVLAEDEIRAERQRKSKRKKTLSDTSISGDEDKGDSEDEAMTSSVTETEEDSQPSECGTDSNSPSEFEMDTSQQEPSGSKKKETANLVQSNTEEEESSESSNGQRRKLRKKRTRIDTLQESSSGSDDDDNQEKRTQLLIFKESNNAKMKAHYFTRSIVSDFASMKHRVHGFCIKVIQDDKLESFKSPSVWTFNMYIAAMGITEKQSQELMKWMGKEFPFPSQFKSFNPETWKDVQRVILLKLCSKLYRKQFGMSKNQVQEICNAACLLYTSPSPRDS